MDSPVSVSVSGIMGEKDDQNALRKLGTLKRGDFLNVFNVNVVGNMLLGTFSTVHSMADSSDSQLVQLVDVCDSGQALYDNVKKSGRKQIIGISSGMGSISDCGSNSCVPYRCSKVM